MKTHRRQARRGAGVRGALLALSLSACGGQDTFGEQPSPVTVFSPDVRRIEIEVDYAPGAEPYLDTLEPVGNPFVLTLENLRALFANSGKEIVVPMDYGSMQVIDVPPGPYDGAALVRIAAEHRDTAAGFRSVSYYAVWLDGFYEKEGKVDEAVLGAALPDFGVVAMFKPAVTRLEHPILKSLSRFTEQSAFIHEMGHVLGLVDTGLPQAVPHEDATHSGHCVNPDCVMFWANEGADNLRRFAAEFALSGNEVLFDDQCLADARAAASSD